MTNKHRANKLSDRLDRVAFRLPDDLKRDIVKFAEKNDLLNGEYTSDVIIAFMRTKNGVGETETVRPNEPTLDGDRFECNILCKNFRGCTSNAMYDLEEIKARNCYVPDYPRYCKFLLWEGSPYGDPDQPYPKCLDPRPPIAIPRDRIIRDPRICWKCMKIKKQKREQRREENLAKRSIRNYRGQPRVNWGKSEGYSFL